MINDCFASSLLIGWALPKLLAFWLLSDGRKTRSYTAGTIGDVCLPPAPFLPNLFQMCFRFFLVCVTPNHGRCFPRSASF